MKQLMFNNKFDDIIDELPSIWKSVDDIPDDVIEYISDISSKMVIYDENMNIYRCSTCFNELDDNYCKHCKKQYDETLYDYYTEFVKSFDRFDYYNYRFYYAFDVVDEEVILYVISETSSRDNYERFFTLSNKLSINCAYWIRKDCIINVMKEDTYFYRDFDKKLEEYDMRYDFLVFLSEWMNFPEYFRKHCFLYTGNLDILKNTIYKYSNIWDTVNTLNGYGYDQDILNLTYVPIHFPQFEYLVKYKLYNLAYDGGFFLKGKTFKEIFGVDKEFLPFMQEINIGYCQLLGLQLCKCKDKFLISWIGGAYNSAVELFKIISPDMSEFSNYLKSFHFEYNHIPEYCDYIRMAKELGYNLKDKNVLYPPNFMEEHDKLYLQFEILNNPNVNNKIESLSNLLSFNIYEDDKYIIFPAETIEDMLDEGTQQHNCLRTYIDRYSNNDCQIYFMREKNKKSKSLVTIEVRGCSIVQARTRFNKLPDDEIMQILRKWERTLLPIENEE